MCQLELAFKLACEALQAILRLHGVDDESMGLPMEILQLGYGYKFGFIDDSAVWIMMLKKRNTSVYI